MVFTRVGAILRLLARTAPWLWCATLTAPALAQCQLANPSFELRDPYDPNASLLFGGWNQFGNVCASSVMAPHGHRSVRLAGPYTGTWAVSGVWQALDAEPNVCWLAAVRVGHRASNPLSGTTCAILNVEWRDTQNELISYESHVVADASTPPDTMQRVRIETNPAPPGTVSTHVLLGVLQGPTQDPGAAFFDLAEFYSLASPTVDEQQWFHFPGGRRLYFSNRWWRVKGPGYYGQAFTDSPQHVWVDNLDRLHLTIRNMAGTWYSTEVTAEEPLGYGDYIFTTAGCLDAWDQNVVWGLFIWQYPICFDPANPWNLHNEIDVELSRMGDLNNDLAQFVVQPWEYAGNMSRYALPAGYSGPVSHAFRWLPDRVECRSWLGGPASEPRSSPAKNGTGSEPNPPGKGGDTLTRGACPVFRRAVSTCLHTWTYTGPHIPRPEQPRTHVNLWQPFGPPSNGLDHEAILDTFTFVPVCVDGVSSFYCLTACLAGPDVVLPTTCAPRDLDRDGDIDLVDVALFQVQFTGS